MDVFKLTTYLLAALIVEAFEGIIKSSYLVCKMFYTFISYIELCKMAF